MPDCTAVTISSDVAFVLDVAVPSHYTPSRRPMRLSPSRYAGARLPLRRPRSSCSVNRSSFGQSHNHPTTAVFLPPGGLPPLGNDDGDDDLDDLESDAPTDSTDPGLDDDMSTITSLPRSPARPVQQLHSIDELLEETTPDYETWVDRNARRSLSTFRGGSQWTLGAHELNESLRPTYLQRHRHVLAPDEAFGALFVWDVVVNNSRELERLAWAAVAKEKNLPAPDMDDIVRAEDMVPEAAVTRVFFWTQDWGEVKRFVFRKHELYEEMQKTFQYQVTAGLGGWLTMLKRYGVRCILCTSRPKERVLEVVTSLGLGEFFSKNDIVSSEDEFDSLEQMILVASLKAERPPGKCVFFTDKPNGITAGHEVSAKVIALIGAHPAYEVRTADGTVSDFNDLVVYNIRRLFSEDGMELMDPQTELEHERN